MDLRWLRAPEQEVAAEISAVRRASRPSWVPTKRRVLVHVNHSLMLWYLGIVWVTLGVRIDTLQQNRIEGTDIRDIVVVSLVFLAWAYGTYWLYRWAAQPPSRRSRMKEWRQELTARANGFESAPAPRAMFSSLITPDARCYPRFVAPGVEFGNLRRGGHKAETWHYLAMKLAVPLPHLLFDATATNGLSSDLPGDVNRRQRLSLEGDFDRWFHLYAPATYERDSLFVLTPDVMAALIDHAHRYNIEIVDDTVVFFTSAAADFTQPEPWLAVESLVRDAVPPLVSSASRYRDERISEQNISPTIATLQAAIDTPGTPWVEAAPRIGSAGRRLERHRGWAAFLTVLGFVGWSVMLLLLYPVPGIFAFAGFMSIVDGR